MNIEKILFENHDENYKKFHSALIPNIDKSKIIGVRVPVMRKIAKDFFKQNCYSDFLSELPHKYYEENCIHAFLIEQTKNFDLCIKLLDDFLPFVDNWATCDFITPKVFKKNTDALLDKIFIWLQSNNVYTIRFAIRMIMNFYLEENFKENYLETVSKINSDEYYVIMMQAWFFATALAKQYNSAVRYLEKDLLPKKVHIKTIQKAVESLRITKEQKDYLRTLRQK